MAFTHGLFGADVLPGAKRTAVMKPFTYRKVDNAYATAAAREYLGGPVDLELVSAAADGRVPDGAQYVVSGQIVDLTSTRIANPDYKKPEAAKKDESLGSQLFRNLERKVTTEVNDKLDRNTDSPYLRVFNVDVQVEIHKLADDSKVVNLERRSYKLPETNTTPADLEKTAVTDAVRETLELTLKKYPL